MRGLKPRSVGYSNRTSENLPPSKPPSAFNNTYGEFFGVKVPVMFTNKRPSSIAAPETWTLSHDAGVTLQVMVASASISRLPLSCSVPLGASVSLFLTHVMSCPSAAKRQSANTSTANRPIGTNKEFSFILLAPYSPLYSTLHCHVNLNPIDSPTCHKQNLAVLRATIRRS